MRPGLAMMVLVMGQGVGLSLELSACSSSSGGERAPGASTADAASPPSQTDGAIPVDATLADGASQDSASADAGADAEYDGSNVDNSGNYGGIIAPSEALDSIKLLPPSAFLQPPTPVTLPSSVMLTNLPAVATQGATAVARGQKPSGPLGSPGTCEAQAFGRGLGSYTAARNADGSVRWDPSQDSNLVSAAWLYDWLVSEGKAGPCPAGGGATPYLAHLILLGAPSEADYPYQPVCSYLSDTSVLTKTYPDAPRFKIGGFGTASAGANTLELMKGLLNAGQAIAFTEEMMHGYTPQPTLVDGVFYGSGMPHGGHGELIVGYDDTVGAAGKLGAFVVQNSMSPEWGTKGRVNFAYTTLLANLGLVAAAWPVNPSASGTALMAVTDAAVAPAASIVRSFQWSPKGGANTYLVLVHHFAQPVTLGAISLAEPGGLTARAALAVPMSDFYTYIVRTDGNAFVSGRWGVAVDVALPSGALVRYTGTVTLDASAPMSRTGAPMQGVAVTGPTGQAATLM